MAQEYGSGALRFLYGNPAGRLLLKYVAAAPWFSERRARSQRSPKSKKKIAPFVEKYGIDLSDGGFGPGWSLEEFATFDDFFTRKRNYAAYFKALERAGRCASRRELPAVADASLYVCQISEDLRVRVKESTYTLDELTGAPVPARYRGGNCLVFRLELTDYHRFVFPDSGKLLAWKEIPGELHTVRPISEKYNVYARNKRTVSVLETQTFGELTMVEVGAILVGHIVDHLLPDGTFARLSEKGYFAFGGSTIVLLTGPNVKIDDRFLTASAAGNEIHVRMGEPIGKETTWNI